jgi:hypothetical protein
MMEHTFSLKYPYLDFLNSVELELLPLCIELQLHEKTMGHYFVCPFAVLHGLFV